MSGDQITEDQNQTKADTFTLNKPVCNSMCVCFQLELQGQEVVVYDQSSSDPASLSPDAFLSVLLAKLEKSFPSVHLLSGESNTSNITSTSAHTDSAWECVWVCHINRWHHTGSESRDGGCEKSSEARVRH